VGSVASAGGIWIVCAAAFILLKGHCMSIWIVSILLVLTLVFLITERIPIDLTAGLLELKKGRWKGSVVIATNV
jgi:hypothetical protein